MKKIIFIMIIKILALSLILANDDIYLDMSLEELYNIEIFRSASKRPEDLFEVPLSVTIIKRQDIINAGVQTIPEALRLAPGLIVREVTAGNYDVHIRGFDTATSNFQIPTPNCSIILVMVNDRVIYDYFSGGTFWESVSVDVNDIERIEVIRGPASALYGPNAVAGVINIITTKKDLFAEKFNVYADIVTNQNDNKIYLGTNFKLGKHIDFSLSANYQNLVRNESKYYSWKHKKFVDLENLDTYMFYPEDTTPFDWLFVNYKSKDLALEKSGINFRCDLDLENGNYTSIELGAFKSESQKVFYNNFFTPLSYYSSEGYHLNFKTYYNKFLVQFSANQGKNDNNYYWNRYNYENHDINIEYDFSIGKFYLRPAVSHRASHYGSHLLTDRDYSDYDISIPKEKKSIYSVSYSIFADFYATDKLRLVKGVRYDNFSVNDKTSETYEMAATYRYDKDNLFRAVISKADRTPFMLDTFIGKASRVNFVLDEDENIIADIVFQGSENLPYLTAYTTEFGWRKKISSTLKIDTEFFVSMMENFSTFQSIGETRVDTVFVGTEVYYLLQDEVKLSNDEELKVFQWGLSSELNYRPNFKSNYKLYFMLQETIDSIVDKDLKKIDFTSKVNNSTPTIFGGFSSYNKIFDKFSLSFNAYFCSKQVYQNFTVSEEKFHTVPAFISLNSKINYSIADSHNLYLVFKNITGTHREYAFVDRAKLSVLLGCSLNF